MNTAPAGMTGLGGSLARQLVVEGAQRDGECLEGCEEKPLPNPPHPLTPNIARASRFFFLLYFLIISSFPRCLVVSFLLRLLALLFNCFLCCCL